jgi:ABC-type dipeptide/oligopeptide/nickel transport system ATPase subunit
MKKNQSNKNQAFLSIRNVEKIYPNGEKAVYNFNLDVYKNEFIVVVGPSGCGKSTVLRMIAGLEDITSGTIYMEGELLNYKPSNDRKMAIVFQSYALYPQMNVYDNMAFPLTINKYPFPVVNQVMFSCNEAISVIEKKGIDVVLSVVRDTYNDKCNVKIKYETIANKLNIDICTARRLFELFVSTKSMLFGDDENKVKNIWLEKIQVIITNEKKHLVENEITLNERFCELDAVGNEKIVYRKMTPYEIKVKNFRNSYNFRPCSLFR